MLTAGLGGMGGAQPLAGVLAGAATLVVEVDPERVDRRLREGYLQHRSDDLDEALALVLGAKERGEAISVGLVANIADVLDALLERGITPDIVTDQTTTDPIRGYMPRGMTAPEADELRASDRDELIRRADATLIDHIRAMLEFQRRGAEVFEYGNGLRARAQMLGVEDAFDMGVFTERYIRPLFCEGVGPFRWLAISGDPQDIYDGRRHHPRALRGRADHALDHRRARGRAVHRACRRASAGSATATAASSACSSTTRSRAAASRARSRSRATTSTRARWRRPCARRSACATAPTASPTGRS